jgi:hypothetical protein
MFLRYVLAGVLSMASAEFQVNVLLRGNIIGFFMAMMMYAVLTAIAYAIGKRTSTEHAGLYFYFYGGMFGLVIIEWWLIGFYPGSGKAGVHAAMFTNWAVVFSLPRLFTAELTDENRQIREQVKRIIIRYSLGAPLLVLLLPISRGGTVAILMSVYSLLVSFKLVPFLCQNARSRKAMRNLLWLLVVATVLNIVTW